MQHRLGPEEGSMKLGQSHGAGKHLLLISLALGLASTASAQQPHPAMTVKADVDLQGTVRVEGEKEYSTGAIVRLEELQGGVVDEQRVSANGQFYFPALRKAEYTLIATAAGHETYTQRVDLTSGGGPTIVNITLRLLKTEERTAPGDLARTDIAAPHKARKELERGVRASEEGKLSEAHAHFEKAVQIYPCYARAQEHLALTLMRERDSAQAEAPLKKAIECDPDFVEPYLHLGRLFNTEHRYLESREVLAEGVRRAPSSWQLYYHLGQADEGLGNYALAEQELLRALSFGRGVSASVHEKLADVYLRENAYDKAYAEMRAYLQADPDGPYAARIRVVMQQLESAGRVHPSQSQVVSGLSKQ
jgi:tetratricopeptide (TPR) repeat protein